MTSDTLHTTKIIKIFEQLKNLTNLINLPKAPLYLSSAEIKALTDIDENGIVNAKAESLEKLEFLAACLRAEIDSFTQQYPDIKPAGLSLDINVLLPVWEPVEVPGDQNENFLL